MNSAENSAEKSAEGSAKGGAEKWTGNLQSQARLVAPENGSGTIWREWGSGPRIVLLHGSAGSWTHWFRNIEALAAKYTVLVPDLPGNGDSKDLGDRTFVALAARLLGDISLIAGNSKFTLVGFSFGAIVAQAIALAAPERVERLVLVRGVFDEKIRFQFPAGMKSYKGLGYEDERAVHAHNLGILMLHDPKAVDDAAVDMQMANVHKATVRPQDYSLDGMENVLSRIGVPIVGIRGEFDVLGGDLQTQINVLLSVCPDAKVHVVEGAGHWVAYEKSEALNSILLNLEKQI